jgi:2'-5' RNA ligase
VILLRYVIVSVVKGAAGDFNNNLRKEVFSKYGAKSSKLPAHFTIKAPFEYDGDISNLESALEEFSKNNVKATYSIDGFDHFAERVIYMKVDMSSKGKGLHDRLIDTMSSLPYIDFDKKDGKKKVFHITVASKRLDRIYNEVWEYVNSKACKFECEFDNITIYKWQDNTWRVYKEYFI